MCRASTGNVFVYDGVGSRAGMGMVLASGPLS